jgi:hypothetical protein
MYQECAHASLIQPCLLQEKLARLLFPILQEEIEHEQRAGLIRRSRTLEFRVLCGQYPYLCYMLVTFGDCILQIPA